MAESVYNSTITSSKEWVIANGKDQSTITVTLKAPNGTVLGSGVSVKFALASDSLDKGTLSLSSTTTDSTGSSSTTFTAKAPANHQVRDANILINASYNGTTTDLSYTQKIDHDVPYHWTVTSPSLGSVGTQTNFNVTYTDQWGNFIDHHNPADPYTIQLEIGSPSGKGAFVTSGGNVISTSQKLDDYGNLSVKVLLDTEVGQNNIHIYPFYSASQGGAIPDEYPYIVGIANGAPVTISLITNPDPPQAPADEESTIALQFTLYDQFGNPTVGQNITLTSSRGDSYPGLMSNDFGIVGYVYGPTGMAGTITLTATAESPKADGSFATLSKNVTFYSTAPVNWVLSADPQTMPSFDANSGSSSKIIAQVQDELGNPVANQMVTFSLGTPTYDLTTDNVTSPPKISSTSVNTGSDGNAIIYFIPGGFSVDSKTPYYNPQATGKCTVTGTWNGSQQSVQLLWKNYPYLSAYTSVSPANVTVNGTVNVTVKLTGDGWALIPNPIDVVLLIDRSGSMSTCMAYSGYKCTATEMSNAQAGAKNFGAIVNGSNDRIGVVSYSGMTSGNNIDTVINTPLTTSHSTINSTINALTANGATGTRDGLYQSITLLKNNPNANPKAVRAVILLTDGNYNWLGNPLGRGTGYYPAPPTGYTGYSGSNIEKTKYLYYSGLGGTLTPIEEANFIGNVTTGRTVQFTDKSLGTPSSWSWDFGDGGTSMSHNPTYTYSKPSSTTSYTVTETVTYNTGDIDSITQTNYITVTSGTSSKATVNNPSTTPTPVSTAPDGQLTDQNMTNFARDNNIRLYMISYYNSFDSTAISDMQVLAAGTGGFYANAPDANTLNLIYKKIAGDLKTAAGVNTSMSLDFQNVILNNVTVPGAGNLSYVPQTQIIWQNTSTSSLDQSAEWTANHKLSFNIGTINLSETWQATFQLKVLTAGSIQLFGPASTVVFNNGADSMIIPPVYITAFPDNTSATGPVGRIVLSNLAVTQTGTMSEFVPLQWNTYFPGAASSAWERLYYSTTDQPAATCGLSSWSQFDDKSTGIPPGDSSETSQLDVRSLPQGTYYICVIAQDPISGALPAVPVKTSGILVKTAGKSYIKLE